jgi:hypothetical protein
MGQMRTNGCGDDQPSKAKAKKQKRDQQAASQGWPKWDSFSKCSQDFSNGFVIK